MSYYTSSARKETIPVDLDFGHGFIPRIGEENNKAVDRCVGQLRLRVDRRSAGLGNVRAQERPVRADPPT